MFEFIKNIFGGKPSKDYKEMIRNGAIILDVRTKGEFASGHINQCTNIPLDNLKNEMPKFKDKNKTIICCCASGIRSGMATRMLKANGFTSVYNGGSWGALNRKI